MGNLLLHRLISIEDNNILGPKLEANNRTVGLTPLVKPDNGVRYELDIIGFLT
jgi:hypothetical protein